LRQLARTFANVLCGNLTDLERFNEFWTALLESTRMTRETPVYSYQQLISEGSFERDAERLVEFA
jgi:hypothetical protein